jgi:hypothetical protein
MVLIMTLTGECFGLNWLWDYELAGEAMVYWERF